ncbi:MAG: gamma-glutamyltransferase, partial [Nocardioides sp.]
MRRRPISLALSGALALTLSLSVTSTSGSAAPSGQEEQAAPEPPKNATAVGRGGAVTSVDPNASRVGLRVL